MKIPDSTPDHLELTGVNERGEEMPVFLNEMDGVLYVRAYNQGGYDSTDVNLSQLIKWLHENRPDLLVSALREQLLLKDVEFAGGEIERLERELAEIKAFAPAVGQAVDYLAMKGPDAMRDDCMGRLEVLEYKLRKPESALPNVQAQR